MICKVIYKIPHICLYIVLLLCIVDTYFSQNIDGVNLFLWIILMLLLFKHTRSSNPEIKIWLFCMWNFIFKKAYIWCLYILLLIWVAGNYFDTNIWSCKIIFVFFLLLSLFKHTHSYNTSIRRQLVQSWYGKLIVKYCTYFCISFY